MPTGETKVTRLDAIRERLNNATPGPWWFSGRAVEAKDEQGSPFSKTVAVPGWEEDAELIAHAPEDLADLLAVAEAAKEWREAVDEHGRRAIPASPQERQQLVARVNRATDALRTAISNLDKERK